jgi:hypothetical protein
LAISAIYSAFSLVDEITHKQTGDNEMKKSELATSMIKQAHYVADFNRSIYDACIRDDNYSQALRMQSDAEKQIDGLKGLCIHLEVYKGFATKTRAKLSAIEDSIRGWK